MSYTEIKKPLTPYLTVVQALRARGDEYMARGDKYWEEGKQSHADGCWKKAEKKYNRANAFEKFLGRRRA